MKKEVITDLSLTTYALVPEKIESVAIFFHGYGADGQDLFNLSGYLGRFFPNTAFFFPDAPTRMSSFFGGYEWFSLDGYDPSVLTTKEKGQAYLMSLMPLAEKTRAITEGYVQEILNRTGVPASKLAICGFSQGGLMAVYTALKFKEQVALTVGLSAVSVMYDEKTFSMNDIVSKPPVLLIHGDADGVVPLPVFEKNIENLTNAGLEVSSFIVPDLPHGIDEQALIYLKDALDKALI